MPTQTQHGYLVLADISGYTAYLAGVELDHAHEILSDLLETVLGRLTALLTFAKLEGDAVFAYAPEANLPRGETLLELIESTYFTLNLKFFIHHGDYVVQEITGIKELVGTDVNLAHRD